MNQIRVQQTSVVLLCAILALGSARATAQEQGGQAGVRRGGGQFAGMQRVNGEVTAISGATLTIKTEEGVTMQVVTTDNTRVMKGRGLPGQGRPAQSGSIAQPFVEQLPVDHPDKTAVDRHIDRPRGWRHHASRGDPGRQKIIRDREIRDQPRRDRSSARFDPAAALQQQNRLSRPGQFRCRGRPRWAAADNDRVESLEFRHHAAPPEKDRNANAVTSIPIT